jgi:hypothetical protein
VDRPFLLYQTTLDEQEIAAGWAFLGSQEAVSQVGHILIRPSPPVQFIPGDSQQRAFATLVNGNALALVNPTDDSVKVVYGFDNATCIPHVSDITNDGKRYFVSCIGLGQVWMLDISNPENPIKLDAKDTGGPASNPHFVRLTPNDDRLFVSNYFVTAGLASSPGNRNVLSFTVGATSLTPDAAFGSLSFGDIVVENGVKTNSRPHGMTVNYLSC